MQSLSKLPPNTKLKTDKTDFFFMLFLFQNGLDFLLTSNTAKNWISMLPPIKNPNIKNIPPEALPAYENDQNYYVLTARGQFLHSKPLPKKGPSTLGMTTFP